MKCGGAGGEGTDAAAEEGAETEAQVRTSSHLGR